MAGRAPSVVFSVEYFSAWRALLHSEAANVESSFGGRAGAAFTGSVGRVHFAVFFTDVWVADGVLQLRGAVGDGRRGVPPGFYGSVVAEAQESLAGGGHLSKRRDGCVLFCR